MCGVYGKLRKIDVSDHVEEKNGLKYLSWAWAWDILMDNYPDSFMTVYETPEGMNFWTDGKTAWVKVGITVIDGEWQREHIEMLPIMDHRNKSIPLNAITSCDVNKSIQRAATKAIARHGLGMYIFAGEDIPPQDGEEQPVYEEPEETVQEPERGPMCDNCENIIRPVTNKDGGTTTVEQLLKLGQVKYGRALCADCMKKIPPTAKKRK